MNLTFPVTILVDQISTNEKFTVDCATHSEIERVFKVAEKNNDCSIVAMIDADDNHFSVNKK